MAASRTVPLRSTLDLRKGGSNGEPGETRHSIGSEWFCKWDVRRADGKTAQKWKRLRGVVFGDLPPWSWVGGNDTVTLDPRL